ncbi:RNA polymerase II C-terminal domain kinase beta subunit [Cryptotrichosporon argae]
MPVANYLKRYRPYFTPAEVERLSAKQRGKLSVSREERERQRACAFIDAVGARCGFPRRTIATAQTLYMRFHLFFPYSEFHHADVALTVLYVSSKLHDTLKKPRDIILASYALRFPHLVKRSAPSATSAGAGAGVDPSAVDPAALEGERRRVMGIERLVLETMCFSFGVDVAFPGVVKLGRKLGLSREDVQHAFCIAVDCHRTTAPLSFPPHVVSLASIYAAALFLAESTTLYEGTPTSALATMARAFGAAGAWEAEYHTSVSAIDDVAHALLDLYITVLTTPPAEASPFSPSPSAAPALEPARAAAAPAISTTDTAFRLPAFWTAQTLTALKIALRDRRGAAPAWDDGDSNVEGAIEGLGDNEATVRFLWD